MSRSRGVRSSERPGRASWFSKHCADLERLLGAFDPFVLASHRVGQPRPAIEVAASGPPIVATERRSCDDVALRAAIERLVGAGARCRDERSLGSEGAPRV